MAAKRNRTPRSAGDSGIDIQIIGDSSGVQAMLNHLDTALNPVAVAGFLGATVDPYLRMRMSDRFRKEGDDVVGKWTPLAQVTQDIRQKQGFGSAHPINRRTGRLEDFIVGSPNQLTIHSLGATLTLPGNKPLGEMKDKVETAQKGRLRPHTLPRPVLGMNERDLAFVLTALAFYVKRGPTP
jgi:hypothetical protein